MFNILVFFIVSNAMVRECMYFIKIIKQIRLEIIKNGIKYILAHKDTLDKMFDIVIDLSNKYGI